jgi:hypothetical protein
MAERKTRTVVLDGNFVRREAAEAVHTFFRPVIGAFEFVREASNPDKPGRRVPAPKAKPERTR